MWVFSHPEAVVYRIAPSRGQDVVREFLEGSRGTIVHDGWVPYDIIRTARHQLDLLHVNRWLEREEILHRLEPRPLLREVPPKLVSAGPPPKEFLEFADGVRSLLRQAIEWSESHPDAPDEERRHVYTTMRWMTVDHLRKEWRDPAAARIARECGSVGRPCYLPRGARSGLAQQRGGDPDPTGGIYRKISGGRRSWSGAWALERLLSIYRMCRKRNVKFMQVLKDALSGSGYPEFGAPSARPQT